jgi:pimeloyl-ACP methyl ester carboxylesterase
MSSTPVNVIKAYMPMDWGQLHYRTVPADPALPLLIMLHQSPLSSRNYEAVLPLLAGHCRPVALDTPGYGGSSAVPEDWTVADYAQVVWDLADRLAAERVFVFGRATGAVFALEAALAQPQRVQGLVLHGMPVYTDAERTDRMQNFAPPFPAAADGAHLTGIWKRIHNEYPWIGPELATHFAHDFLSAGPDFARSYRAIWRYDLPQRLAAAQTCRRCCSPAAPTASPSCTRGLWRCCRGRKRCGSKGRQISWPNNRPHCLPGNSPTSWPRMPKA